MALTRTGGLLLCGLAFGIVIQRSRFCFVRAFRDPFMTGEGEVGRAVSVSLIISVFGFAALKWTGIRGEDSSSVVPYGSEVCWVDSSSDLACCSAAVVVAVRSGAKEKVK